MFQCFSGMSWTDVASGIRMIQLKCMRCIEAGQVGLGGRSYAEHKYKSKNVQIHSSLLCFLPRRRKGLMGDCRHPAGQAGGRAWHPSLRMQ